MTAFRAAFKAYRMHQVLLLPRFARLTIALSLATAVFPVDAEYYFNPRFLSNDLAESVDLSAFTKGREAPPGTYRVDIYLNDEFMTSRDITFIADDNNADLIPCLSTDLLVSLGIKKSALLDNKEHSAEKHVPDNSECTPLQDRLADASTEFDVGQQHLSLSVPQIYVGRMARGYVSPDLWEEGINAGLLNYSFNGNSINNRSNHNAGKSNYAYLNLQSGINIGSWRLRDNSTWSYNSGSSNSSDSNKWQHINTSAERDIIPLRSRLTVGDSYTDGDIMGVEASATHVNEMSNPGRDYPLAMLLLMVAAICLSSVGGLSIAMVIPGNEINLSAGVMQTFTVLMSHVAPEIEWTVRVISALLLLGVLAEIASWIVGPSRGMYVTAQKNLLPAAFAKMNKNGVPVTLVISQLVITSIALIILTNTGGGNNMSFLIALALTVVIYLCAYFMLFIGYIVLVLKHPDLKRTFNIPGGKGVKLVVAIVGLLTSIMAFIVSFLPPDNIQGDSTDMYVELLVVSFLVVLALPFILYAVHDRKGKANTGVTLEPINSQNAPKGHFFLHPRARSPHYIVMNDKKH